MTVLLRQADDPPAADGYTSWASIGENVPALPPQKRVAEIGFLLEQAFEDIAGEWKDIGRALSAEPTGDLTHTAACAANLSDLGLMMAWSRLASRWALEAGTVLLVVNDPWMFRHLAALDGVEPGRAPALRATELKLAIRGLAARTAAALRFARSAMVLRGQRRTTERTDSVMVVYGHPQSTAAGDDGYFGDMMRRLPGLGRILHVDCPPQRARELEGNGTTASLHAWSSPADALTLISARWRPARRWRRHPHAWLIRRAQCIEGGTATGAAIRWQQKCQRRWLSAMRPATVTWPWENHAWERDLVRCCRAMNVATVGYQHSVVGRQMLNYAPTSNPDGLGSIPDTVLCTGRATVSRVTGWGLPETRVAVGGAWRLLDDRQPAFDRQAPVFMALPFDARISAEMVAAAVGVHDREILVKPHPMTPYRFADTGNVRITDRRLSEHDALSAVVYAASTVGLEAVLAGLPTYRFQPQASIAMDILPEGVQVDVVDHDNLQAALRDPRPRPPLDRAGIFASVDPDLWRDRLNLKGPNAELA